MARLLLASALVAVVVVMGVAMVVAAATCYDAVPDRGAAVLNVLDGRSVVARCVGFWYVHAPTSSLATRSRARRVLGGHSDRTEAVYVGLSAYATNDFVECTCFGARPLANLSAVACAHACPDPAVNISCGTYGGADPSSGPAHPVALYERAALLPAVACEDACRYTHADSEAPMGGSTRRH
jgi:hypothetical protein